jgi:hypothetical protein
MDVVQIQRWLLGPICQQWTSRLAAAQRSKERFDSIAKLCRQFYGSSAKAMWEDNFRKEFFPNIGNPTFKININKAFELVAVIGPSLFWDNPERTMRSYDPVDQVAAAQLMGITQEEQLQAIQQQAAMSEQIRKVRNELGSQYLQYSQNEQPIGLKNQSELGIQEALLTGLGLMWTETYTSPATGETKTQNVYDSVDNLLLDPDARDPDWKDVRWMARRHRDPVWEVERRFGYPPGYLTSRGTACSAEWDAAREAGSERYNDLMDWTEIWSVGGVGARTGGVEAKTAQFLDSLVGDYAYLCISPHVPHPLNLPPAVLEMGTPEAVVEALRWRTSSFGAVHEVWKDNRWPVEPLKFYRVTGSVWPLAVLAPGLGHLIAMNVIAVAFLQQTWDRRRDFIGVAQQAKDSLELAIRGDANPALIPLSATAGQPLAELIQYLDRPAIQGDMLSWMDWLADGFAKATGLLDIYYGVTKTQVRVSSDVEQKNRAANVRPEKMASDVVIWVNRFSTSELWLAAQHVPATQLTGLLGPFGAMAWQSLMNSVPLEVLCQEMEAFIDAKDLRRPDYARDLDALQTMSQTFFPAALQYATATGDPTPLNAYLSLMFKSMDMRERDYSGLMFGSFAPPQSPEMQALQQRMVELQAGELEAKTQEIQAKAYGRIVDTTYKQQGITPQTMQRLAQTAALHKQKMAEKDELHLQGLIQDETMFQQELRQLKQKPRPVGSAK